MGTPEPEDEMVRVNAHRLTPKEARKNSGGKWTDPVPAEDS